MNIVLFGATGYIGSHVAEQLIKAGQDFTCIVRKGSNQSFLKTLFDGTGKSIKILEINFKDFSSLDDLANEETIFINCIADTRSHASYEQRKPVEIELTKQLYTYAQDHDAKRYIQLSTVMAYGFSRPGKAIDEKFPPAPKHIYSKVAADKETALIDCYSARKHECKTELIILRPSNTLGKRDISFLPNFIQTNKLGLFPVVNGGHAQFSCIDARDVGRAMLHLCRVEVEKPETFLVKGFDMTWLELKLELDKQLGRNTKVMNLPKGLMLPVAKVMEMLVPYGHKVPMTQFDLDVLSTTTLFNDQKIRQTGFEPQHGLINAIEDALN